jgi:hypothetical protein
MVGQMNKGLHPDEDAALCVVGRENEVFQDFFVGY